MVPATDVMEYERIWVEALNRGDLATADSIFAKDCLIHISGQPEPLRGPEQWKQFLSVFLTAFPDIRFVVEDQVVQGDKVAHRWTSTGTHTGPLGPVPPTGKKAKINGLVIDHLVNGKVQERWELYDNAALMQQLGLAPS
jgi:steroid delta-isomerase-like uncharacterized protein